MLSVITPCYNEEESLNIFYNKIIEIVPEFCPDFEIIFVDDGSSDSTLDKVKELNKKDNRVQYVSFSRNFGKEAGILAGFKKAKGEYIALMDVDMQDPVELLPKMYDAVTKEGYDMAGSRRVSRTGEPPIRSFCAKLFYLLMQKGLKINIKNGARDFHLMKRNVLEAILSLDEKTRFSKAIFPWIGFKVKTFEFQNIERAAGITKWSFVNLVSYALDGIFAFSNVPLTFMSTLSGILFLIAVAISVCILCCGYVSSGYISWKILISALVLLFWGVQLLCFSILGQYIAKIYTEVKQRPHYLIREES